MSVVDFAGPQEVKTFSFKTVLDKILTFTHLLEKVGTVVLLLCN